MEAAISTPAPSPDVVQGPPLSARVALRAVQLCVVGVVLAALPYKLFDLDRFFIPKELLLHLCAATAALAVSIDRRRRQVDGDSRALSLGAIDIALLAFLVLSAGSSLFAINGWLATRALAISASGAALYWSARHLRRIGSGKPVLSAAALAVVIGATTALIQAYFGPATELFSINRAPGGTFGNRNFMAHLSAIGAPSLLIGALATRSRSRFAIGWVGSMILAASLVLSRSRAAWLALAAAAVVMLVVAAIARPRFRERGAWRRALILLVSAGAGAAAAAFIPNRLNWNSANPYLDSMRDVVNYKEGSGKGRLVQYKNSLDMALAHPVLGVGPGNWPVSYPEYASRRDPSLADEAGMTDNPWPSSDWVAFVAERGAPAMCCLLFAMVAITWGAMMDARGARALGGTIADVEDGRAAADLIAIGTVVAAGVVGTFDAALLLAAPNAIVWTILGASAAPGRVRYRLDGRATRALPWAIAVVGGLAVSRSATQIVAMSLANGSSRGAVLERAAMFDPGNYKIRIRAARAYAASCKHAVEHARAARDLFPNAGEPKRILRGCGK